MRKSKKLIAVLITAILGSAVLLTGCAQKPVKADVAVEAFYNLYILGNSSEIEKIALTKDEVTKVYDLLKSTSEAATKKNVTSQPPYLQISNDQLDTIYNAQMEALKKLTVTTEIVSEDGDNATVKLTTTYVDMTAIDTKAGTDAGVEVLAMGLTNQAELYKKIVEVYTSKLSEGLKAAVPSTDTKETTFECSKKTYAVDGKNKDIYAPVDMEAFGAKVATMATGA